jgi:hypothetical protein
MKIKNSKKKSHQTAILHISSYFTRLPVSKTNEFQIKLHHTKKKKEKLLKVNQRKIYTKSWGREFETKTQTRVKQKMFIN